MKLSPLAIKPTETEVRVGGGGVRGISCPSDESDGNIETEKIMLIVNG